MCVFFLGIIEKENVGTVTPIKLQDLMKKCELLAVLVVFCSCCG